LIKSSDALGVLSSIPAAVFWLRSAVIDVPETTTLFGSRVRGNHGTDSDVDVRLFLHEWKVNFIALQSGTG
jgi:hypothetical protein